jgi:hypothetical protein
VPFNAVWRLMARMDAIGAGETHPFFGFKIHGVLHFVRARRHAQLLGGFAHFCFA